LFNKALTLRKLGRDTDAQCCIQDAVKAEIGS
jgi:hypothetical protein